MNNWLDMKKAEVLRERRRHGDKVDYWDGARYLKIIADLQREIRRLKVKLGGNR